MKENESSRQTSEIHQRIAQRIGALRAARGLSLDLLAKKTGVSRSMISLIERGEASPTVVVLDKLAFGLGVTIASLFEASAVDASPHSRHGDQLEWTDPQSGYTRRAISPPRVCSSLDIIQIDFPAGASVTFAAGVRDVRIDQQVWILKGRMECIVDGIQYDLQTGDCLAMRENSHIVFQNASNLPARYALVVSTAFLSN